MKPDVLPTFLRVLGLRVLGLLVLGILALVPLDAGAAEKEKVYWLFSQNGGKSWCAYADSEDYRRAVGVRQPAETARAVMFAGDAVELEYQVTPERGDWAVMDKYSYTNGKLGLRRTNVLVQEGLEIVQETTITGAAAAPFRVVSATTLDGKDVTRTDVNYPEVPVRTSLKAFAFLNVARKMNSTGAPELCEKVN